jgi:hypothetical protein
MLGSILNQGHLRLPKMEEAVHKIDSAMLRRLVPTFAVGGVLAFSLIASVPSLASNGVSGYGNNCGVKGTGYHDHGKVCPNRPFPGKGVTEAPGLSDTTSASVHISTASNNGKKKSGNGNATILVSTSAPSVTAEDDTTVGHGHGHGIGKGHGRGNPHN